jgi:hypothetical protein
VTGRLPLVRTDVCSALRAVIAAFDEDGDEMDRILHRADPWELMKGLVYVAHELAEFSLGANARPVLEAMALDPDNDTAGTADGYLAEAVAGLRDVPR